MKKGFTLIELLAVLSIFGIMIVIGVPAFSRYGSNAVLLQKAEEMKELINQTYLMSQNPEQGVEYYKTKISQNEQGEFELDLVVKKISNENEEALPIKTVGLSKNQSINYNASDSPYLLCYSSLEENKGCQLLPNFSLGWNYFFQLSNGLKSYNISVQTEPKFDVRIEETNE